MDPNACLEEILRLVALSAESHSPRELAEKFNRLAELVAAMDGWLSTGGFLPKKWERQSNAAEAR